MVDKVGYTRPTAPAKALRKAAKAGGSAFSDALSSAQSALAAGEMAEAGEAASVAGVQGASLLGFQEVDPDEVNRKKAFKHGKLTLEALSQLRDALLLGALPVSTIERLERLVKSERGLTTDPRLNAILDEIELRAAVEMAKLEVAMGNAQGAAAPTM